MKIGIDAGCLGVPDKRLKVGVYQMAVGLLKALGKIDKKNNYILYSFIPIDKSLLKLFGANFINKVVKPSFFWSTIWLPIAVNLDKLDIFIGLSQYLPKIVKKIKKIVYIYDLTFEKHPSFFPKSYNQLHRITKYAILNSDKLIAISQATKKDIIKLCPQAEKKIKVIYPGFNNRFKEIKSEKNTYIKKTYFLFVGSLKESKNIPNLIRAFSLFCKNNKNYDLVIAGSDFWMDNEIKTEVSKSSNEDKIKIPGFVSDFQLSSLYKNAAAFVSPAHNEGFGFTYLEAARFKVPIIASKNGSVFEIFQDSVLYCNPSDPQSITKAMNKIINNKSLRKKLSDKAYVKSKSFSWEKSATKLLNMISINE